MGTVPSDLVAEELWCGSAGPEHWMQRQREFASSTAVASMVRAHLPPPQRTWTACRPPVARTYGAKGLTTWLPAADVRMRWIVAWLGLPFDPSCCLVTPLPPPPLDPSPARWDSSWVWETGTWTTSCSSSALGASCTSTSTSSSTGAFFIILFVCIFNPCMICATALLGPPPRCHRRNARRRPRVMCWHVPAPAEVPRSRSQRSCPSA